MSQPWTWSRGLRTAAISAIIVALFIGFCMPLTAQLFFELYHATGVEAFYPIYSGFKAAGAFLPEYGYLVHAVVALAVVAFVIALIGSRIRGAIKS